MAECHNFWSYLSIDVQFASVKNKKPLISEWSVIAGAGLALSGRLRHVRTPATNMPADSGL